MQRSRSEDDRKRLVSILNSEIKLLDPSCKKKQRIILANQIIDKAMEINKSTVVSSSVIKTALKIGADPQRFSASKTAFDPILSPRTGFDSSGTIKSKGNFIKNKQLEKAAMDDARNILKEMYPDIPPKDVQQILDMIYQTAREIKENANKHIYEIILDLGNSPERFVAAYNSPEEIIKRNIFETANVPVSICQVDVAAKMIYDDANKYYDIDNMRRNIIRDINMVSTAPASYLSKASGVCEES